jgi:hypothetical protein
MIDGVDVPCQLDQLGTNPTSFVQAGNLEVGAGNGGLTKWNGRLAQVWVGNGNVSTITQATLRSYKNQTVSGAETNCIGAWKLDQASGLNDLTSTNNLTATGSPTYSTASPFTTDANGVAGGTYDYAIVTKVATTVATVQYPEGCAIPTSGGITTVDIATTKAPFGMSVSTSRWTVSATLKTITTQNAPVAGTWYNMTGTSGVTGGSVLSSLPVGEWVLGYEVNGQTSKAAASSTDLYVTLSTANNTESDNELTSFLINNGAAGSISISALLKRAKPVSVTAAQSYFLNTKSTTSSSDIYNRGEIVATVIRADFAYL